MTAKFTSGELDSLEKLFIAIKGRGFSPRNKSHRTLSKAVKLGYMKRENDDFFSERRKNCLLSFTDLGKHRMLARIAKREALDVDDLHHLIRAGRYPFTAEAPTELPAPPF
jgi:hypothetical protein